MTKLSKFKINHLKPEQRTLFDDVWSGKDCIGVLPHFRICRHDVVVIRTIHACKSLCGNWDPMINIDFFGIYTFTFTFKNVKAGFWLAGGKVVWAWPSIGCPQILCVALIGDDFNEIGAERAMKVKRFSSVTKGVLCL